MREVTSLLEYRCSLRKQRVSFTNVLQYGAQRYLLPLSLTPVSWAIACPFGRRRSVPENQGLSAIAFFEATAFLILLVLFILFLKDHPTRFLTVCITDWSLITLKAIFELTQTSDEVPQLRLVRILL